MTDGVASRRFVSGLPWWSSAFVLLTIEVFEFVVRILCKLCDTVLCMVVLRKAV